MNHPEQSLQKAVARYLDLVLAPEVVWSAVSHGATLGGTKLDRTIRGANLKRMGQRRGLADIYIAWKSFRHVPTTMKMEGASIFADKYDSNTLWLELKSRKGSQSPEQASFESRVTAVGHYYFLCRDLGSVMEALEDADVPMRVKR